MKTSKNQKASANVVKPALSHVDNKQSAATRANSANRLVGGTLAVLGVASLATGGILMGHADVRAGNTAVATASTEAAAPQQGSASPTAEVPYTPSKYPGVMVRNVPQPAPAQGAAGAGMNKGWIYVKPGAPKPRFGTRYGPRGAGIWYEPGKTKAGGTAAHVDRSFYPYVTAKVTTPAQKGHKGKVALECIDGGNAAQHEAIANGVSTTPTTVTPPKNKSVVKTSPKQVVVKY